MKKNVTPLLLLLVVGLFAGNRIFNHFDPWIGIGVIALTLYYIGNRSYKLLNQEENNEKE